MLVEAENFALSYRSFSLLKYLLSLTRTSMYKEQRLDPKTKMLD